MTRGGQRFWVPVVALLLALPHLALSLCVTDFGADGGYYSDIAENVRDGLGLQTDVSIFHQGFPHFPFPTPVYPIWPLVYGLFAHLGPISVVGVWLPTTLFFVILGLAFAVGRRLAPRLGLERWMGPAGLGLHGGHAFLLVTALTSELSSATARPYTEGLAYTLVFALFLRAPALWLRLGPLAGLEFGAWLMALFLTRSQLVVVALGALVAAPLALWARPRSAIPFVAMALLIIAGVWTIYIGWVGTFLPDPTLTTYIRFDLARVPSGLSAIPIMVETGSTWDHLVDLAGGFPLAFALYDTSTSYFHLHHAFIHALPIAVGVLAWRWRKLPLLLRFARTRAAPNALFFTVSAIGLLLSLHTVHKVYGSTWVFGSRHAIPSLFLVGTSVLFLLRARSPGLLGLKVVGFGLLLVGAYDGWRALALEANDQCLNAQKSPALTSYRSQLRSFFESERARLGSLTVAVERPEAQRLAWRTPGVGFHWLSDTTTVGDLALMVHDLGVAYIVDFDDIHYATFADDPTFALRFAPVITFAESSAGEDDDAEVSAKPKLTRVYAPRCAAFVPRPATCIALPAPPQKVLPSVGP